MDVSGVERTWNDGRTPKVTSRPQTVSTLPWGTRSVCLHQRADVARSDAHTSADDSTHYIVVSETLQTWDRKEGTPQEQERLSPLKSREG